MITKPTFEGTKEVFPLTRLDIDDKTYCDVSILQFWESIYRSDCSCGVEKSRTYKRKWGFSKQESVNIEGELGFSLNFGLASLSPKIAAKTNKTLTTSIEEESEDMVKFKAPDCGKHEIAMYQLISRWHIEPYKIKKRFLRKMQHLKLNSLDCKIRELEWTDSNKVYDIIPNCNCKVESKYNGNATLAINSGGR
ncbi:MAG TPA: hypothetical protein VKA95_06930 [Nitrososphaeraceae archaeon]|nr:hypothetical protein [Nitrososphaeraceae archaeon]